jgi:hypothetical protein
MKKLKYVYNNITINLPRALIKLGDYINKHDQCLSRTGQHRKYNVIANLFHIQKVRIKVTFINIIQVDDIEHWGQGVLK